MEKDDLINKLENMNKPDTGSEIHKVQLRMTLLNAKRSSRLGVIVAIIPVVFLSCIFLKYLLHLNFQGFTSVENRMSEIDKNPFLKVILALVLIGGPLIGLGINILALVHIEWHRISREILITFRIRWKNIVVLGICLSVLTCFLLYIAGENCK